MDANHLSLRLARVANYVPKGARMADIGSDHAYLPAHLALNGQIEYAVAGEVVKGPFENAAHEIKQLQLDNVIQPRLADGLAAIQADDRIDTITIAGMGGTLIAKILAADTQKLAGVKRLILQPNVGGERVREWLLANQWQIMAEEVLEEDDHIYEIIVAEPSIVPFTYNDREIKFGPFLLEQDQPAFRKEWLAELEREQVAIEQMKKAAQPPVAKIKEFEREMQMIKEVIK